ncbi:MAG: trehalose-phosphatase, partial [Desulfobia sp.]
RLQGPDIAIWEHPGAEAAGPALTRAARKLRAELKDIPGVEVERKYYALAVHYRRAEQDKKSYINEVVSRVGKEMGLRKTGGKEIAELRPDLDWDKGKAVAKLRELLGCDSDSYFPVFVGDDLTDEDGFAAVREQGAGILVGCRKVTAARYRLKSPREVAVFLDLLTHWEPLLDEWTLLYKFYSPEEEGLREVTCALGNGYFVTRAASPETEDDGIHYPGTYLAGGYNRLTSSLNDQEVENEDLVNQVNWLPLSLRVKGGEWFHLDRSRILSFRQELDLKGGILRRHIRYQDNEDRVTSWHERRLVSMADPHYAGMEVEIIPENWSGKLEVWSALDAGVVNNGVRRYRDLQGEHLNILKAESRDQDLSLVHTRTSQSGLEVAVCSRTRFYEGEQILTPEQQEKESSDSSSRIFELPLTEGNRVILEKIVALYTSKDRAITEPVAEAYWAVKRAPRFQSLLEDHWGIWRHLWQECDLEISCTENSTETLLKMRFNIFHLLQTVSPHIIDLDVGVPARGWHGEAYRGHIFWDELFIFPFLNFRLPALTRSLLLYRYRRLPAARRAAAAAGAEGAMYPWQSGSNGREETQTLHLNPESNHWIPDNSHRQRHINSAIAYNIWRYYEATEDNEFLYYYGAEMILEIARFWASIVSYNRSLDRYEIKGVMGPDEFHTAYPGRTPEEEGGVDNNSYTNLMVSWVLHKACRVLELLPAERRSRIRDAIGLKQKEIDKWDEISRKIRIIFQKDGIISQFEGYEKLEELDWDYYHEKYGDIQRLDRILEAEGDTTNRYKVAKQADVLMLFYLFSADELSFLFEYLGYTFDPWSIPRNINYYRQRTSHGSTLSRVVHSWLLARTDRVGSWQLFREALNSDIHDIQDGTTAEGIHTGAMSGTVDLMHRCYTGLESSLSVLHFDPMLPEDVETLRMNLCYRKHKLKVKIDKHWLKVESTSSLNQPIGISYRGDARKLPPGETIYFRLVGRNQSVSI